MAEEVWVDVWRRTVVVRKRFEPTEAGGFRPPAAPDAASGAERYGAQCRWLSLARDHPVVQLCDVDFDRFVLTTRFAGAATLAWTGLGPAETARLLAAVAKALAALHRRGLVHGNLAAEHIVLNGPRFSLCSPSGWAEGPEADVEAMGRLIDRVVTDRHGSGFRRYDLQRWRELGLAARSRSLSAAQLGNRLAAVADGSGPRFRPARWPAATGLGRNRPPR